MKATKNLSILSIIRCITSVAFYYFVLSRNQIHNCKKYRKNERNQTIEYTHKKRREKNTIIRDKIKKKTHEFIYKKKHFFDFLLF